MKLYLIMLLFTFAFTLVAQEQKIMVTSYSVKCEYEDGCEKYRDDFDWLKSEFVSIDALVLRLKLSAIDKTLDAFTYKIFKEGEAHSVQIELSQRRKIEEIEIVSNSELDKVALERVIPYKRQDLFDPTLTDDLYVRVKDYLVTRGFGVNQISLKTKDKKQGVVLTISLDVTSQLLLKDIIVSSDDFFSKSYVLKELTRFIGKPWNQADFLAYLDQLQADYLEDGFQGVSLKIEKTVKEDNKIKLYLKVALGERLHISIEGDNYGYSKELKAEMKGMWLSKKDKVNPILFQEMIKHFYKAKGFANSEVKVSYYSSKDLLNAPTYKFFVNISEGKRIELSGVSFIGNSYISSEELLILYKKEATPLAARGFYDPSYLASFKDLLKKFYLEKGYVLIEISEPRLQFSSNGEAVSSEFSIAEHEQVTLKEIQVNGVPDSYRKKVINSLRNKAGSPLNLLLIEDDLKEVLNYFQEEGFLFARYESEELNNVISYARDYRDATLMINLNLGKKVFFAGLTVVGNKKTRSKLIRRENQIEEGEILTPSKIESYHNRLTTLGLFTSISITPGLQRTSGNEEHYTLLVQVSEKEYRNIELAPGYRTDIGLKLSTGISFQNIAGMDREFGIKAQANQRLDYSSLDGRRKSEKKDLLEYGVSSHYSEPYLFSRPLELDLLADYSRKRFYAFDADILRTSSSLSKKIGSHLLTSLRYQLETIKQYDATESKDFGYFRIGTLTPSIALDFRDSAIVPKKGALFSFSVERAHPNFYSMNDSDLEINYLKFINRNRFYYPISKFVFAMTASWGVQQNLATEILRDSSGATILTEEGQPKTKGHIPSIKLFRLNGEDLIRGFSDDEANRLSNGEDISDRRIQQKAFFSNFKFEPRYQFSDSIMGGVFFDSGGVYVDSFRPLTMRSSVGVTFKYLTPVGSISLDYGFKTERREYGSGQKESVGRFHLLVGFF